MGMHKRSGSVSDLVLFPLVAGALLVMAASACGGSSGGGGGLGPPDGLSPTATPAPAPAPTAAPEPTPAREPGDLGCAEGIDGIALAGIDGTFIAVFARAAGANPSAVEAVRFDAEGRALDLQPLTIQGTGGEQNPSFTIGGAAIRDDAFYLASIGSHSFDNGAWEQRVEGLAVPTTGLITAAAETLATHFPFGACRSVLTGDVGLATSVAGNDVHTALSWGAVCAGDTGYMIEWIVGIPGAPTGPGPAPVSGSRGAAALATGSAESAGIYFVRERGPGGSVTRTSLDGGWIEAANQEPFVLSTVESALSYSPALAAADQTFLAAWTSAPASGGNDPTELRLLRFTYADGRLDPEGGVVVAGDGILGQPRIAARDGRFLVVWTEDSGGIRRLKSVEFPADSIGTPTPTTVALLDPASVIALAATAEAAFVGYIIAGEGSETCVRVQELGD